MRSLFALSRILTIAAVTFAAVTPPLTAAVRVIKPQKRKHAPDFELKDVAGKPVRLSEHAGKVVLLDFWATWCAPCKASIPWMIELADKYRDAGLIVIGISMDEDGWPVVAPFLEKLHVTYPILLATKRVAYLYGEVEGLPLAFFVDREQRVAAIHLGSANRIEYEKTIDGLLHDPQKNLATNKRQ